jgi:hypothetical protein
LPEFNFNSIFDLIYLSYKAPEPDTMKYVSFLLLLLLACCKPAVQQQEQEKWIQLFNGSDLDDWDIKFAKHPLNENYLNTFRVEEGMLTVNYDEWDSIDGEFGHIFYRQPFSYYRLRVEYRIIGEQVPGGAGWAFKNSGAMLHGQSAESMGKDQSFPVSIEGQLLGGEENGERPTMNLCTPGTHVHINGELITQHCIKSISETFRGEEWVNAEFVVLGDSIIHHLVNGDTVLTYTKPIIGGSNGPKEFPLAEGTPLTEGTISLQSESHPIDFRKVELLDLCK